MNYNIIRKAQAIPEAASMIETFRAIGYNLETAIADIIDNSISANARNIYINRIWRGGQSIITIKDDGDGMNSNEIIQAMRPGAQNPLSDRSENDLGRFGLGLKTASFSQCRKLSVLSKRKDYASAFWSWDLDYVAESDKWELLQWIPEEFKGELDSMQSGTLIVWSDLDRILPPQTAETDDNAKRKFSDALDKVKKHIAMTFHRFIEDKTIKIYWGEHEIEAWNPFCPNENKTQEQPSENINGGAKMKGYVLPHKNNFSSEQEYKRAEGINGYPAQQGFYVYRGKRLLLAGDWLGLFRKEEHYKLVRIKIDLPNKLDTEWQIDIKKSKAYPPAVCREQLLSYAKNIRAIGSEVYRHRGKILKQRAGQNFQPLWLEKKKDNKWSFVVNREHLMIQDLKDLAKEKPEQAIEKLLKFLEEAIPTKTIYINEAQGEEKQKTPFSDVNTNLIKEVLALMYNNQIGQGKTSAQAKALLKIQEPFNNYEDLIEQL
ncbi:ATPase [Porphyromonas cangingivalis]|uniref:ATPase n=1 Tax=Porphyromonas cangingivalis TaxID=36874 RepID=A0A0A2EPY5_PORCN|nr:ATP-binding protein [Porphyromonas cangingivalis]KGN80978.1 ATPase [Porphyromonas cangingivalis]